MNNTKISEYRIGIKFDKEPLAVEQSNYLTKIGNVYIVYDLDAWPRNPPNHFKFKNCLFRATNIVKNSDKEKYVSSGYGITFDSACSWSFDNDFARNVVIFGVGNSSSSHSDHHKNNFLILGEGPTYGIDGSFGSPEILSRFCLGRISDGFSATESRELPLNENGYDFSVDYNSIDKSEILNIHKYLMTKNNIKQCLDCFWY